MQPLLLVSYGAPEQQDDVVPFLNNLFAGQTVPAERMAAAVQKYERYAAKTGHYSPLNSECRRLKEGISHEWSLRHSEPLPIYWGNLFWHPLLTDTVAAMARDGVGRATCFATSVFDSPAGNQRYADALEAARNAIGASSPILEKLPLSFDHPLFLEAQTDRLLEALAWHHLEESSIGGTTDNRRHVVLFSAHSIPLVDGCSYVRQLQATCQKVIEKSGTQLPWELVYQSRSGPPERWLGPDIKERIRELATEGYRSIVVSPIGFFCENMETEYDLDVEVGEECAELGLSFFRSRAVGALPKICRMIVELVERARRS
jgi:ferrochelatase